MIYGKNFSLSIDIALTCWIVFTDLHAFKEDEKPGLAIYTVAYRYHLCCCQYFKCVETFKLFYWRIAIQYSQWFTLKISPNNFINQSFCIFFVRYYLFLATMLGTATRLCLRYIPWPIETSTLTFPFAASLLKYKIKGSWILVTWTYLVCCTSRS